MPETFIEWVWFLFFAGGALAGWAMAIRGAILRVRR
jgi:hypothetical protein